MGEIQTNGVGNAIVKSLIVAGGILALSKDKMSLVYSTDDKANPTQELFEKWGVEDLQSYTGKISNVKFQLEDKGILGSGRIMSREIDLAQFKCNKMGVE